MRADDLGHIVPIQPAAPHTPSVYCDSCMLWIRPSDIEYHCALCNSEGVDISPECFAEGAGCYGSTHELFKRRFVEPNRTS